MRVLIVDADEARRDRVVSLIEGTGSKVSERMIDCYAMLLSRSGHVAGALKMMANWNVEGLQRKIGLVAAPIVFASGDRDRAVPPSLAEEAARLAPRGAFRGFPGLGHLAHEEDPEAVAALIRDIAAAQKS